MSLSFLWVPHKITLIWLWSKLIRDQTFHKRFTSPYFHKRHALTFLSPYLIWCLLNQFSMNTVKCICSRFQGITPEIYWKINMTHHQSYHVQQGAISPLWHTIPFWCSKWSELWYNTTLFKIQGLITNLFDQILELLYFRLVAFLLHSYILWTFQKIWICSSKDTQIHIYWNHQWI